MAGKGRGGGKTPERVVSLLQEEVAKTSQAATSRATGLTLQTVQRYFKGIGEPSQASLEKLSVYFDRSVTWLRGEKESDERRFGQREWGETRAIFDSTFKQLKDLMEIYSFAPEHLKETVVGLIDMTLFNVAECREMYSSKFSENEIEEIDRVMEEANKLFLDEVLPEPTSSL